MKRALAGALLVLLTACAHPAARPAGDSIAASSKASAAELAYGRAPVPGGGVTYQHDVVLVGGGAAAVRAVSGDTMTWSIDAHAAHVSDLKPGKVMFLTGRAVGRVLQLKKHDGVVAVTLGPVDLTDVVADGNIDITAPLNVADMAMHTYPQAHTASAMPSTSTPGRAISGRAISAWMRTAPGQEDPLPPPTRGASAEVSVGDFSAEIGRKASQDEDELSLKVGYKQGGLVLGLELTAKLQSPTIEAHLGFAGGELNKKELRISGLKEVAVGLDSGSEKGLGGNLKQRIEVPAEMSFALPGGPVPLAASVRFKFIVETAFSARNATLGTLGKIAIDGAIGFSGASVLVPTVTQALSPVERLTGVSVGVNGVVLAMQVKFVIGLGIPAAFAGPFAAVTVSYGLTNGSAIGIVQCRQSSIDVVLAGGVGFVLDPGELHYLKKLELELPWVPKLDTELASRATTVVHTTDYQPKVPTCRP